jgi:hypothetical protein
LLTSRADSDRRKYSDGELRKKASPVTVKRLALTVLHV